MNLIFKDAGDQGTGHQLDLVAMLDELESVKLLCDGTKRPVAILRVAVQHLRPAIGDVWADALLEAVDSIARSLVSIKDSAERADERGRRAMEAGETFLRLHKGMENTVRRLRRELKERN